MKVFRVVGSVTLSRSHPTYQGARLLAAEPLDLYAPGRCTPPDPDLVIVWDDLGAGFDSTIAASDGGEAANPFRPVLKAVDAYCSALLDTIHIDPDAVKQINPS